MIVGPGNKWVTAGKGIVMGKVCGIDMLAGPSEVMVLCDESCDCAIVAGAAEVGFSVESQTVEVVGLCTQCRKVA